MTDDILKRTGAIAFGAAKAAPLNYDVHGVKLQRWLDAHHNAGMEYMTRYAELRLNPDLLLENTKTVISFAFNYTPSTRRAPSLPQIASFAFGDDYHDVIRRRLSEAADELKNALGGEWRICVDSAPIFERAWAEICGVGRRCDNGLIAVRGAGTRVLLAEVLTTLSIDELGLYSGGESDVAPYTYHSVEIETGRGGDRCLHCGRCLKACPAGALQEDSTVDARKCLSYLSIEHKGELPEWTEDVAFPLFGCDICQNVCPLNDPDRYPIFATQLPEFAPREGILTLTAQEVLNMTQPEFSARFKNSPVKRSKLAGLRRNAAAALKTEG